MDETKFYTAASNFAAELVHTCPQLGEAAREAGEYFSAIEWVEDELEKMIEEDDHNAITFGESKCPFTIFCEEEPTGSFANAVAMTIVEDHTC